MKPLIRTDGKRPVIGDTVPIQITVSNVPADTMIVKAWVTFKRKLSDPDANAVIQKTITSGFTGTTTVSFTITLTASDTALFQPDREYFFDVQVKDSSGGIYTPLPDGVVIWQKGVTDAQT